MASRNRKKGQAAGAAVLLAIIAALLIMFVILVPPQERKKLLGDDENTTVSSGIGGAVSKINLMKESPGRIDYLTQKEIGHTLPIINIYTKTESKVIAEKNVAYAKRAIFTEEKETLKFLIPDLDNTKDVLLGFNVKNAQGKVAITLNGEKIFDAELSKGNVQPIKLPINILQEENELVFTVSSPGIAFWLTHEMSLDNVKVVADITSVELQSSRNTFIVSEKEKRNLERVWLRFKPTCNINDVGKLVVRINGDEVYNSLPDCDLGRVELELSPDLVNQGENEIVFHAERGTYLLTHANIESELKEKDDSQIYYFELSYEQFNDVRAGKLRVRLQVDFVDIITRKYGDLIFNGKRLHFDTKELSFVVDLSDDVVQGNNALKIKPEKTIDIREMKVDLVK